MQNARRVEKKGDPSRIPPAVTPPSPIHLRRTTELNQQQKQELLQKRRVELNVDRHAGEGSDFLSSEGPTQAKMARAVHANEKLMEKGTT